MPKERAKPPTIHDFSPEAIQRAVLREAVTHPVTLFPLVAAALGGLSGALFSSPVALGAALAASLTGLGSLVVHYFFRNETIAKQYVEGLTERMEHREEERMESLKEELIKSKTLPGVEPYATQAVEQFTRVNHKYEKIRRLLDKKIYSDEEAIGSIWGAAELVYLGVLDNLTEVASMVESISSIDPDYINGRLDFLSRIAELTDSDVREVETLKRRIQIRNDRLQETNELLTRNEEALTQMEETGQALSNIRSDGAFTEVSSQRSTQRLRDLARSIQDRDRTLRT